MENTSSRLTGLRELYENKDIIIQLAKRDVQQRYKNSFLGFAWTIINPLMMLVIYTFVFSVVFKAKWGGGISNNHLEFALSLFCGLIFYNIFGECVGRSPSLILNNPNYVKKVIFPLETLSISALISALFQAVISFCILLIFLTYSTNEIHATMGYIPIILLPLIFLTLGVSWFFASLGVYVRDIGHTINIIINMLFYLTPIFYPVEIVPEQFRKYMLWNPLTVIIDNARRVVLWGEQPLWNDLAVVYGITIVICVAGFIWFQKTKRGFSDVV